MQANHALFPEFWAGLYRLWVENGHQKPLTEEEKAAGLTLAEKTSAECKVSDISCMLGNPISYEYAPSENKTVVFQQHYSEEARSISVDIEVAIETWSEAGREEEATRAYPCLWESGAPRQEKDQGRRRFALGGTLSGGGQWTSAETK